MKRRVAFILMVAVVTASVFAQSVTASQKSNDIKIKSIFGFEFGSVGSNCTVKLAKPFRYFTEATLSYTSFDNRLFSVKLYGQMPEGASDFSAETEMSRIKNFFVEKYGLDCPRYYVGRDNWIGNMGNLSVFYDGYDHHRKFRLSFTNHDVSNESNKAKSIEDRKKPQLALPQDSGVDAIDIKFSGTGVSREKFVNIVHRTLEPLIPIDAARDLMQKGDGKGYFQLALRYCTGEGVERNLTTSYQYLKEAYDLSYPNAVFYAGLAMEDTFKEPSQPFLNVYSRYVTPNYFFDDTTYGKTHSDILKGPRITRYNHSYANLYVNDEIWRFWGCAGESSSIMPSITNETMFGMVYTNYCKAFKLGILSATNEIARLDKIREAFHEKNMFEKWPRYITQEEENLIRDEAMSKFSVMIFDYTRMSLNRNHRIVDGNKEFYRNKEWKKGDRRGVILCIRESCYARFNANGELEYVEMEPEEIKWINERKKEFLKQKKEAWAKEHNMTVEEAERKYEEFSSRGRRPRVPNLLRRGPMLPQAAAEREQQREAKENSKSK